MRGVKFFGSICLTLAILVSLCAAPALAFEPESESGILPPSIMPVIILEGSDYEIGYQYVEQTAELFDASLLAGWQKMGGFTDDEILALKAYQWYIQEQTPEAIDTLRGMADGATDAGVALSYTEVLAAHLGGRFGMPTFPGTEPPGSGDDTLPPSCCHWAAWGDTTADGNLICGNSDDWAFGNYVVNVVFPDDGNSYMNMSQPLSLLRMGWSCMSNSGVWMGLSAGESVRFGQDYVRTGYDVHGVGLDQHIMRFCDTAEEAKDMMLTFGHSSSWNRTIADTGGDAYVMEIGASFTEVRSPGDFGEDDFIYATNNHFTAEGGAANLGGMPGTFTEHGGWRLDLPPGDADAGGFADVQLSSVARNLTIYNMLHNYDGDVDADFGKMMYRFSGEQPDDPFDILEFRANEAEGWETLGHLANCQVAVALPDDGDNGLMYICTGPPGRVAYPFCPGMTDPWFQIDGTHSFYELTLAPGAADLVTNAKNTARDYIHAAYQELMWVNYGDVGFEGLDELYSLAGTEYYEGANWANKARFAGGSEAMLYYAQAATSFTKAQAHAKEIYNALVPPAVTPRDLGLRPAGRGHGGGGGGWGGS